jgi:Flp pilus assembly pilin Flp
MLEDVFSRLWNDDEGALIAVEFLFFATILIIGIIVGLANLRSAIIVELTELGNAILALSQGYVISGVVGCCSSTDGSQAIDIPQVLPGPYCVPPPYPSVIDVPGPCN